MFFRLLTHATLLTIVFLSFFGRPALADDDINSGKVRIAVEDIENRSNYHHNTVSDALGDLVVTRLAATGRFKIYEREELDRMKDEIKLGEQGWVEDETATARGGFKGVQYKLLVVIGNFGEKTKEKGIGGFNMKGVGSIKTKKQIAKVNMTYRIVEVKTGEIILTGEVEGEKKSSGASIGGGNWRHGGAVSWDDTEFRDSALGKATDEAVTKMVDQLCDYFPLSGKILAVAGGGIVVLDLGKNSGLEAGQTMDLFHITELTNDEGEVVYSSSEKVGTVTVTEVQISKSLARVNSFAEVTEGDVVKLTEEKKGKKD